MSQQTRTNSDSLRNQRNKFTIGWIAIVVLSGLCVYLLLTKNKIAADYNTALKQKQQIIDSIKADRGYLQADFNAASARIDLLMSKNVGPKDSIQDYKTAIADLQKQIKTILSNQQATQDELMKARYMIYLLTIKTQAYELYMAELERDNTILSGENKLLAEERDNTVESNIALKMAGSVLHASNVRMELIHERRNGKETETAKAKKGDKLRITFDIDENRVAESGAKQINIRIIAPGNNVLYTANISGTMSTINGEEIKYSVLKEIYLEKNEPLKNVTTDWMQNEAYSKGVYKIELYNQGYKIGVGRISLK